MCDYSIFKKIPYDNWQTELKNTMLKTVSDSVPWVYQGTSLDNKESNFRMPGTPPSADKMSNLGQGGLTKRREQELNGHYSWSTAPEIPSEAGSYGVISLD